MTASVCSVALVGLSLCEYLHLVAGVIVIMSFGTNKVPPKLDIGADYEVWKRDLEIWCKFTELPAEKQALAIHLSLSGKARQISSQLTVAQLNAATGVKALLDKLDPIFLEDKGRRQFSLFRELYNLRRSPEVKVQDFITEFEHAYYKFSNNGNNLPDQVLAYMFLASLSIPEKDVQIVMSGMENVSYNTMKDTIKRVYGSSMNVTLDSNNINIKEEPSFECTESAYYNNPNWRRGRWNGRGRGFRARGARSLANNRGASANTNRSARKLNPLDKAGNVSRCNICDSKFHWAGKCPDAYENMGFHDSKYIVDNDNKEDVEEAAEVHLSLFIGYTNGKVDKKERKLNTLVKDAADCALLDSGCSKTVCGDVWLENYKSGLSSFDRTCVDEEVSSSTFRFGDGVSERSLKRVRMPCYIGGKRSMIETDVVRCNIPLLLSKQSMKKGNMMLDFGNDTLSVCNEVINLANSSSGHYLLPLKM